MARRKEVLTTGDVAEICQVAPRTVSKWFDSGQLKGYRVPGSKDRRIPVDDLIRFMRSHGMPLRGLETGRPRVLVISPDNALRESLLESLDRHKSYECDGAGSAFSAGMAVARFHPHVVLVDAAMADLARADAWNVLRNTDETCNTKVVALAADKKSMDDLKAAGFDACLLRPVDAKDLKDAIETFAPSGRTWF